LHYVEKQASDNICNGSSYRE